MKHAKWLRLSIILVVTVMLSACVVEPFGDRRGDGRYEHDRGDHGEHFDHDRNNYNGHDGEH